MGRHESVEIARMKPVDAEQQHATRAVAAVVITIRTKPAHESRDAYQRDDGELDSRTSHEYLLNGVWTI
jgi:hypothetical protein